MAYNVLTIITWHTRLYSPDIIQNRDSYEHLIAVAKSALHVELIYKVWKDMLIIFGQHSVFHKIR